MTRTVKTISDRPMLIIRVFGVPEITCGEQRLKFPTRKALALLLYLMIESDWHSRERLIALFWPEADEKRGRTVLRQTLKHLRQSLGTMADFYLEIQGDLMRFNSDTPFDSDWHRVLHSWQQSEMRGKQGYTPDLEELPALYRSDFLSTFTLDDAPDFELWVNAQRIQWQQRIEVLFEVLTKYQIENGALLKALDTVQRWLVRCPFSESAYRMLIQLYCELGNPSAALQAYDACRRMLAQELNMLPSPETDAMIAPLQKKGIIAPVPMVAGVSAECAILIEHYQAIQQNGLRVVCIQTNGDNGTPTSITEFLQWATAQNADVMRGKVTAAGDFWIDLLRTRIDAENAPDDLLDDLWLSEIATLLPELYDRYPDLAQSVSLETYTGGESLRLFEAVARLGMAWAKRITVVMLIEDIQRADQPALDLLNYVLLRWQGEAFSPIMVLLTQDSRQPENGFNAWLSHVPRLYKLTRLDQAISGLHRSASPVPHNLPVAPGSFVGRERELAELARLLDTPDLRLITIAGMGGMGKTRLALEVAYAQLECFRNGVYFVSLAPLTSSASIPSSIAEAMHFRFYQGVDPSQQLQDYLREKQVLLVLDNFEHLLDGVGVLREILQVAPGIKIIATSRERLNMEGETVFHLDGLDFPDLPPTGEIANYNAVRLFLQNVRRLRPDIIMTDEHLAALVRICHQLDGMPLGLLLAANWIEVLSLPEIAEEIAKSLDFLETRQRDLPSRQRSLRAVFDYSWQMFTTPEQLAFMKISVFRGGFTREAAQKIAGVSLPVLLALVEKSILRRDLASGRFEIHELLRQYGAERLRQSAQIQAVTLASHIQYFSELLSGQASQFYTSRAEDAMSVIAADYDNIRAVWDAAPTRQMAFGLVEFFHRSNSLLEMQVAFDQAVRQLTISQPDGIDLGVALCGLGKAHFELGNWKKCRNLLQQALPLLQGQDCLKEMAYALELSGIVEIFDTHSATSSALDRALEIYRQIEDRAGIVRVLTRQVEGVMLNYDLETGAIKIRQACALATDLQDNFLLANVLFVRAYVEKKCGNFEQAVTFSERGLSLMERNEYSLNRASGLNQLGLALAGAGDHERAEQAFREVCEIADAAGNRNQSAITKTNLCWSLYMQEKYQDAFAIGTDALLLHREFQSPAPVIANDLCNLAHVLVALERYAEAETYYREALSLRQGSDDWHISEALGGLANLLGYSGQVEHAISVLIMLTSHPRTSLQVRIALETFLARLRTQLSPERYAIAGKNGARLEREIILQEFMATRLRFD